MYSYGSLVYSLYNGINKYDLNVILNSCINMRNVTTFDYNVVKICLRDIFYISIELAFLDVI